MKHKKKHHRNPAMSTGEKIAIGLGIAVLAGGAVAGGIYLYRKHGAQAWQRATTLSPGQKARITGEGFTVATLQPLLQLAGSTGNVTGVTMYGPGQSRPVDWPLDDPSKASKWANATSAEFTYTGGAALSNPFPATVPLWVQSTALAKTS